MSKTLESTLETNKAQKEYYNSTEKKKRNFPSRIYARLRNGMLSDFRAKYSIKQKVYDQHKEWLGNLEDKKVLDLGCLRGNALSLYMAKNSKEYWGIDLSDVAIAELNTKLVGSGMENAKAVAADFLSPEFEESEFDIIYAYGVLHHFENFDLLLSKLEEKLATNGVVISYDPLETSLPVKLVRVLYRPFQSDKDWEWPFTKKTIQKIDDKFQVLDKKGILGRSKYGMLINLIPLGKKWKEKTIKTMIEKDWNLESLQQAYSCMHLTMMFKKR